MPARSVLYTTESNVFGGAERYLKLLWRGLDRDQFEPTVAAPASCDWISGDDKVERIDLEPIAGKGDIAGWRRQRSILREVAPDIVHLNLSNPLHGQFTMLAAEIAGIPVRVATMHLPPRETTPTRRGRWLESLTVKKLGSVISVCQASGDRVQRHFGVPDSRADVVYNGIDLEAFDEAARTPPEPPIASGAPVFGTFGRMTLQKGFDIFIDAAAKVLEEVAEARFVIAGDGPLREELVKQASRVAPEGHIVFTGAIREVAGFLTALDVLVLPSRYESFPFAVLEAMGASLPIIASNVDGVPEAIVDGHSGILVPSEDPAALSDAFRRLLTDPDLGRRLGSAARRRLAENFTAQHMVTRTEAVYRRCLASHT